MACVVPFKWIGLLCVITHSLCYSASHQCDDATWMTVIIHGTTKPQVTLSNIFHVMSDSWRNSTYERSAGLIRRNPFFFSTQPIQGLGLQPIDEKTEQIGSGAWPFKKIYQAVENSCRHKGNNLFYTFGWTGLLSYKGRLKEAKILYDELTAEIKRIQEELHVTPKVRIIAYSHGGNLVLNLACYKQTENIADDAFKINEFIMIGTPIQPYTDHFITDPIFERVYNIYSHGDAVQKLEVKAYRKFTSRPDFKVPKKVIQIKVRIMQESVVPNKKYKRQQKTCIETKRMDPGHIELWYFGWSPAWYRRDFALYPLPVSVLVPKIIDSIDESLPFAHDLVVDIRPDQETIVLGSEKAQYRKMKRHVPFMSSQEISKIQEIACEFSPNEYFKTEYNRRLTMVIDMARLQKRQDIHDRTLVKKGRIRTRKIASKRRVI